MSVIKLICFFRKYNNTRFIVSHYWDTNEPNLLFCETKSIERSEKKPLNPSLYTVAYKQKKNKSIGSSVRYILFVYDSYNYIANLIFN